MQVGLVTGKHQLELVEMPEPEPTPGKAVVDIAYCGICGTDLHAWLSGTPYNPAICGHEWVGHVAKAGSEVATAKEGDRVGIGVATACGSCAACARGDARSRDFGVVCAARDASELRLDAFDAKTAVAASGCRVRCRVGC